jgi:transcription elongation GreA/GreB family factor
VARVDKREVLRRLRARVGAELEAAIATQKEAHAAAVHEEARPESDKDTRATEGSYLARGLAMRVAELATASARLESLDLEALDLSTIAVGALVEVSDEANERLLYFIAPAGAGETIEVDGVVVLVITPRAPLCRALLGKETGDDVEFVAPRGARSLVIETID